MAHAIHDFTGKLRQPGSLPTLERYIQWRRDLAEARKAGTPEPEPPAQSPVSINLDLTTACNYRCDHCIDWDILNTRHKHNEEILRKSLSVMRERGLKSVIVIGGGEPTLYPGFVKFTEFLKEIGLQVAIVSNGSRGDRLLEAARCMDSGDWIRLSLDSGSNELFREMHKPVMKELDLDEICSWIPKIKAVNPAPKLGYSYIIVWSGAQRDDVNLHENIDEIVMGTKRARDAGFDYISLKPVLERGEDGAEVMDPSKVQEHIDKVVRRIRAQVDEAKTLATDDFAVYESINLRVLEEGNWEDFTNQPRTCHMQALRQVLTPTGLYNCPAHRGLDKAKIGEKDAFETEDALVDTNRRLGGLLDGFDASVECREVTCLYNKVNWWIERMIDDPRSAPLEPSEERADYFL